MLKRLWELLRVALVLVLLVAAFVWLWNSPQGKQVATYLCGNSSPNLLCDPVVVQPAPQPVFPPQVCGMPCDPDLSATCAYGLECLSGVCLSDTVCNGCGATCATDADCPNNFECTKATQNDTRSFCYNEALCAPYNPAACGASCSANQDCSLGLWCFRGGCVGINPPVCQGCAASCRSDSDCSQWNLPCLIDPSTPPDDPSGHCWDESMCRDVPSQDTGEQNFPADQTPIVPTVIDINTLPLQPQSQSLGSCGATCEDSGQCGTATRPDGQDAQLSCFNAVCWDSCACGDHQGCTADGGDGGSNTNGVCTCEVKCIETDRSGNCTKREYRDCNNNSCSP